MVSKTLLVDKIVVWLEFDAGVKLTSWKKWLCILTKGILNSLFRYKCQKEHLNLI